MSFRRATWVIDLLRALWPLAAIVLSVLRPGPGAPPEAPPSEYARIAPSTSPPADTSGSHAYFSIGGSQGGGKVFWTIPESGHIHISIVIPPSPPPHADAHRPGRPRRSP